MRPDRPFLVGLVCWVLIIAGSLGVFSNMRTMTGGGFTVFLHSFPYPPLVAGTILFGSFVAWTICGICIYEGQGWARFVYVAVSIPYFVQQFLLISHMQNVNQVANDPHVHSAINHMKYIEGAKFFLFLVSIVLLFLPLARRYFHPPTYVDE